MSQKFGEIFNRPQKTVKPDESALTWDELSNKIIGAAIDVHKRLGPGYHESVYQKALSEEFSKKHWIFTREEPIKIFYGSQDVGFAKADFCVNREIVVELKAVQKITDHHKKQVQAYLKAKNMKLGLILNFGKGVLEIKRVGANARAS